MDAMTKMWLSIAAVLIMGVSVFLITFARTKTKGWIKGILSLLAFFIMLVGFLTGLVSIT
ncbi:DUF2768 family protein [Paenibacillus phoenicis]|jgi:hypothetical protein|uniref:DUF2768 domain-containing protein n=3 Tax=Paenibacillus TaxID=44249 RepID=R9LFI0_9BACL|nr:MULTISPECIES: DUF2768 family protein [Paenibacillus]EES72311.1 hypothetical protein POTG_03151 [Paenibacillus sp. oral taxon 786 str. D14]EOS57485.1 hypothetical protein C812_01244 [Paenibacillus barengoltzii G22]MCT2196201.1 DUF2768 family protein [Paenibacillus sp. p3-SID1389]MDU0329456.1 DUF2768 family protein [Paenibacillus sp. 3LSP]MEA3569910.1 DUF2768 family protein [Paenibacillus phoenicis]